MIFLPKGAKKSESLKHDDPGKNGREFELNFDSSVRADVRGSSAIIYVIDCSSLSVSLGALDVEAILSLVLASLS